MRAKRLIWLVIVLVVGTVLLVACGSDDDEKTENDNTSTISSDREDSTSEFAIAEYRTLSIDEFADIVETRPDEYLIINTHIPYAGDVENTDVNIPYNDLDALTAAIPDKDTPVILYCRSGNMSEQASNALVEQGYTQVWDVPGGMVAWQDSGRNLIDK